MKRKFASLRGWIALLLALFACVFLPATFPARNGHTGKFMGSVGWEVWAMNAVTIVVCIFACAIAMRGSRVDKVAGFVAALLVIVLLIVFGEAVGDS
jgi:cytochrome bd-type quinol oxidase subunit 2